MKKINNRIVFTLFMITVCSSFSFAENNDEFTLLLAGDAIITQEWSQQQDPNFTKLISKITAADAAVVNLEMVVNDFKGYAQAQSGGIHLAARAEIANELAWAGFDMASAANNHTFDYGSIGALETVKNIQNAGMVIAGAGADLQTARAPAYFTTPKGTVSLVSVTSSFQPYGIASRSRPDMQGRPGPNFCRVIAASDGYTVNSTDAQANLASIQAADAASDYVIMSVHWHHSDMGWLREFAHNAIDAGADIVFCHGPHSMQPIELYKDKVIFYGLGDFVFQNEQLEKLPVEQYDMYGLGDDATPEDVVIARYNNYTTGFPTQPEVWEGVLAEVTFNGDSITNVDLIPVDLRYGEPVPPRGSPIYADAAKGLQIISDLDAMSQVPIEYDELLNCGRVQLVMESTEPIAPTASWLFDGDVLGQYGSIAGVFDDDEPDDDFVSGTDLTPFGYVGNQAVDLDGDSDFIHFGNPESLQITDAMTVSLWLKRERDSSNTSLQYILSKWDFQDADGGTADNNNRSWVIAEGESATGQTLFIQITGDGAGSIRQYYYNTSALDAFDNQWHHVVFTFSNNVTNVYLDGQNLSSIGLASYSSGTISQLYNTPDVLSLGALTDVNHLGEVQGDDRHAGGLFDELAIWDSVLTDSEILWLYNNSLKTFDLVAGDANADGSVNLADFSILSQNYSIDGWGGFTVGDFDSNETVDIDDLEVMASAWLDIIE